MRSESLKRTLGHGAAGITLATLIAIGAVTPTQAIAVTKVGSTQALAASGAAFATTEVGVHVDVTDDFGVLDPSFNSNLIHWIPAGVETTISIPLTSSDYELVASEPLPNGVTLSRNQLKIAAAPQKMWRPGVDEPLEIKLEVRRVPWTVATSLYPDPLSGDPWAEEFYTYGGQDVCPYVTVSRPEMGVFGQLHEGYDYTVSYKNNVNAGDATVIITGINDYEGKVAEVPFLIQPYDITNDASVSVGNSHYPATGKPVEPAVCVSGGRILEAGTDYTTSYSNNTNAGTATVYARGIGNYTGKVSTTFAITDSALSKSTITLPAASYTYTGKAITPAPTVKLGTTTLKKGTDYTVAYSKNTNKGKATVTVTGTGNYKGTAKATFTIA